MDTQSSFQSSRLQIQAIHNSVEKLKDIADRMTARALGNCHLLNIKFIIIGIKDNNHVINM